MTKNGLTMNQFGVIEYDGWHLVDKGNQLLEVLALDEGRIELATKIKFCERFAKQSKCNIQFKIYSTRYSADLDAILIKHNYRKNNIQLLMAQNDMDIQLNRRKELTIKILELGSDGFLNQRKMLKLMDIPFGDKECICEVIDGGHVVARVFSTISNDKMGIFNVFVEESYRRKGYGEQLLRGLFHWGRTHGAQNAYLNVDKDNTAAIALYKKLNFTTESQIWIREKTIL